MCFCLYSRSLCSSHTTPMATRSSPSVVPAGLHVEIRSRSPSHSAHSSRPGSSSRPGPRLHYDHWEGGIGPTWPEYLRSVHELAYTFEPSNLLGEWRDSVTLPFANNWSTIQGQDRSAIRAIMDRARGFHPLGDPVRLTDALFAGWVVSCWFNICPLA